MFLYIYQSSLTQNQNSSPPFHFEMPPRPCINKYIIDKQSRVRTFRKRWLGLIKKASELAEMCGQELHVFTIDREVGGVKMFSSSKRNYVPDYQSIKPEDRKGPEDVRNHFEKKQSLAASEGNTLRDIVPVPTSTHNKEPTTSLYNMLWEKNKACLDLVRAFPCEAFLEQGQVR